MSDEVLLHIATVRAAGANLTFAGSGMTDDGRTRSGRHLITRHHSTQTRLLQHSGGRHEGERGARDRGRKGGESGSGEEERVGEWKRRRLDRAVERRRQRREDVSEVLMQGQCRCSAEDDGEGMQ
jgi:hypothetical protein